VSPHPPAPSPDPALPPSPGEGENNAKLVRAGAGLDGGRGLDPPGLLLWLLPFLAGAALRLWNLPQQILGGDEVHALRAALNLSLPEILVTYQTTDNCIPLTALDKLLMAAGLPITEMALRLPVLLCGLAALLALPAAFAGRVSRGTVLVYRWLVAISPALVLYSRIARSYMPMVLFAFGAVMAFELWWRTRSRLAGAAYVLLAGLAVWLHLGAGPIVAAPFLFAAGDALARRRELGRDLRDLVLSVFAVLGVFALFLLPARRSLPALIAAKRAAQAIPWRAVLSGLARLQAGTAVPWLAALFWLAAVAGWALLFRRERRLALYTAVVAGGHAAGLLILSPMGLANPLIFGRYLLPILPFVLLWTAAAFGSPWALEESGLIRSLRGSAGALFVLALAAVGPFADPLVWRTSFLHHDDFVGFHALRWREPAGVVPGFYRRLRGETIVEAPWVYFWNANRTFYRYQEIHGGRVVVATVQPILFRPPVALRNTVAPSPAALCGSGARFVLVHRDVAREEDRMAPGGRVPEATMPAPLRLLLRESAATLADRFQRQWGEPVYADRWLLVWDLRQACGGGTQRTAAAASARAASASPATKLTGR
jgi:hypothetical protein